MSIRVYSAAEVHAALPWPALARTLRAAFTSGDTEVPLRQAHGLGAGGSLLLMPAWSAAALGVKLVTVMPQAAAAGLPTVQASYLLFDRASGAPLALLDGEALTVRRTAAASALAAQRLARADARTLLMVGAGRLAPWLARAHLALQPGLVRVLVWARGADNAEALALELRREGIAAQAVDELAAAVVQADIISCATTATAPPLQGGWLQPGTHLDLVGGFRPDMREVDDAAVARCACIVVDTRAGALAEAGDLVQPLARGVITLDRISGELAELLRGDCAGRTDRDQITLFKSVGTALEDLAAAQLVVHGDAGARSSS
jgi:ornithine cyclodeaminase/alanine dehydrogenase-like protein (mu-crystallin family)